MVKDVKKRYSKSIFGAHNLNKSNQQTYDNYSQITDLKIKSNIHLVHSIAEQFRNEGLSYIDLINSGNYGLVRALNSFDETKMTDFIAYAESCIKQSIIKGIQENERNKPIPINKIGLLSEMFRRIKKDGHQIEHSSFNAI